MMKNFKPDPATQARTMLAVKWLADRCDFATSADGQGFSGVDAPIGHALAEKEVWSRRELLAATKLAWKYKGQLTTGGVDLSGIEVLRDALQSDADDIKPLSKYDIVKGEISVDCKAQVIILKTGFHRKLVDEIRELVGREWFGNEWRCTLCAENAAAIEDIANRYGFGLKKHAGWNELASVRAVEGDGHVLRVFGVSARAIIGSLEPRSGDPEVDERAFRGIERDGATSISISLRSWVIRGAVLWLQTLDGDNLRRIGWAREEMLGILQTAYPKSLVEEGEWGQNATAINLEAEIQNQVSALVPAKLGDALMRHQWVAVKALVENRQAILADQQGLGKTIEILAALEATNAFPAIVIAPATALLNWRDEIANWLPHRRVSVIGGGVGKRDQGVELANAEIMVVNYEAFQKNAESFAALKAKALVADEAQYLKNFDADRTKAVKEFSRMNGIERIIVASGTPAMNEPSELLTLLTLLPEFLADLGGFAYFAARYCRATAHSSWGKQYWDYGGAANLGELSTRLRETGRFVRREKARVLPGLKSKLHEEIVVELSNRDEYQLAVQDFSAWLKSKCHTSNQSKKRPGKADQDARPLDQAMAWMGWHEDDSDVYFEQADRSEALRRIGLLRQLAGVGKIVAAAKWIQRVVQTEKVVVFAYHLEVQEALANALKGTDLATPLAIAGGMSAKARHAAIEQFQQDPSARLLVCSLKAAQTAITLTAAQRVLMVELDWTPAALEQAEDRVHRIGQKGQVTISYLHARDTLDDRMLAILSRKRDVLGAMTARTKSLAVPADPEQGLQVPESA